MALVRTIAPYVGLTYNTGVGIACSQRLCFDTPLVALLEENDIATFEDKFPTPSCGYNFMLTGTRGVKETGY